MGLEATCQARWPGGAGDIKALLEARALILRGALRQTIPVAALQAVKIDGDRLSFEVDGGSISLTLGAARAQTWAKKIATPPPSLASKLGLGPKAKAYVVGQVNDAALSEALNGLTAAKPMDAAVTVAVARDSAALAEAIAKHEKPGRATPLWIIHGKGKGAFGETQVREIMRPLGYIDSKVSAVSDTLSATRYGKR